MVSETLKKSASGNRNDFHFQRKDLIFLSFSFLKMRDEQDFYDVLSNFIWCHNYILINSILMENYDFFFLSAGCILKILY